MTQPSSLPHPPTVAPADPPSAHPTAVRPPRPGELTAGWTWVVALSWIGVFVGFAGVWKASRELGLPTWWLGPVADQQPIYVTILPFLAPLAVVLLAFTHNRYIPWIALGAGLATAAIAAGDFDPFPRFGAVELAIAAAGTAVALASFAGRYRSTVGSGE